MRRRRNPAGRRNRRRWKVLALGVMLIALLLFLDARLRPIIESMAVYQARIYATRVVNDALLRELEESNRGFENLVMVTQNGDGMVTSVQTDMMGINLLKTHVAGSVIRELESLGQQSIRVPAGTLLGSEWLTGRGPEIEIQVIPVGYVQSEVYNEFVSAGINQTLHRIMLRTTVQMEVLIPGYRIRSETVTGLVLAETVIVGTIPDSFTQINGDEAPLISKINDYAN